MSGYDAAHSLRAIFSVRMLVITVMGFASGLPLLLTGSVLQAWMREDGVDLSAIGLFALVGLPYTLKFVWAPLLDRYVPPLLGRRRGWLMAAQVLLIVAIIGLSYASPAAAPVGVAIAALLLTFFSATQDIAVDAYRREALAENELGLGSSFAVNGYRVGMLLAGGGGLILADMYSFQQMYLMMAGFMLVGVATTVLAPEPAIHAPPPATIYSAVVEPFIEYFQRPQALWILVFILLYKVGDSMAAHLTTPFYLDMAYSKTEIGAVVKLFGFWATIAGGLLGGIIILRIGIYRSLWLFGILQAVSTAGFALLAQVGHDLLALTAVISFENLSSGMGTAAFVGFMAHMTDKRFTATQYALLTSLTGVPRVLIAAPTGYLAEYMGWPVFFLFCTVAAIPGLWMLSRFRGWLRET